MWELGFKHISAFEILLNVSERVLNYDDVLKLSAGSKSSESIRGIIRGIIYDEGKYRGNFGVGD